MSDQGEACPDLPGSDLVTGWRSPKWGLVEPLAIGKDLFTRRKEECEFYVLVNDNDKWLQYDGGKTFGSSTELYTTYPGMPDFECWVDPEHLVDRLARLS